jgi:hypothetical protein
MTRSLLSVWHRRRTAVLLATATVAASVGWALAPGASSAQTADPPFTVEVSQTTGLIDGDRVEVTVQANPGTTLHADTGERTGLYICGPGVTYASAADVSLASGNCPVHNQVSTSSQSYGRLYALADGTRAEGDIAVGVGIAEWEFGFPPVKYTLECGPGAPCLLVVRMLASVGGGPVTEHFVTQELTFTTRDETAGCGSRNPAAVRTAGSDRLLDLWANATLTSCRSGAAAGATTSFAPSGEAEGIDAFAQGRQDVAYSAAGYRPVNGLDPDSERNAVYTPVALNAVVIAAMGGQLVSDDPQWPVGLPKPYTEPIRMTAGEAATLVGQGLFFFDHQDGAPAPAFLARNPEIGPSPYWRTSSDRLNAVVAVQEATAVTLFATTFFDERAPAQWVSNPSAFASSRGVTASFGTADPQFALSPVSQKIQIGALATSLKQNQTPDNSGPAWVLTDYATAIDLGLTPVAIENALGEFVLPTPESIAAGVATMTKDEDQTDGRRVPDPDAAVSGAYPLTMIEYAMAPAEPLLDAACAPRAESQQLLSSWLTYLTGPGQATLAPDFVPLTPELAAEAGPAIAQVGASQSTAVCAPINPGGPTGPGGATPLSAAGGNGSGGSGSGSGGRDSSGSGSGSGVDAAAGALSPSTPDELAGAAELADAAEPTLPPFLGIAAVSEVISPVALLLVVVLTSGAAFLTSGRPAPPALSRAGRKVASAADTVVRRLPGLRRG